MGLGAAPGPLLDTRAFMQPGPGAPEPQWRCPSSPGRPWAGREGAGGWRAGSKQAGGQKIGAGRDWPQKLVAARSRRRTGGRYRQREKGSGTRCWGRPAHSCLAFPISFLHPPTPSLDALLLAWPRAWGVALAGTREQAQYQGWREDPSLRLCLLSLNPNLLTQT